MEKNTELTQGEELSHCLDMLNDGSCPVIQDKEIEELIDLAAVVKQSYQQQGVPRLLIDEIVDKLANELGGKKQKYRTHWLYGGLVCAAATLFIAIGVQFLVPQSSDKNIAQEMEGSVETKKVVAVAEQGSIPVAQSSNLILAPQIEVISREKTPVSPPAEISTPKVAETISDVLVEIIQVAQSPVEEEKTSQVAILEQEAPKERTMDRNLVMARMAMDFAAQDDNQIKSGNTMLVQPNEVAQSVILDKNSGTIRQVYHEGTEDQIIITQRVFADSGAKMVENAKRESMTDSKENLITQPNDKKNKNARNSLTLKVDKYSITIEGNKTNEELEKIVQSLIYITH